MIRSLYKLLLRLPEFRGRHRLDELLRRLLKPSVDVVDGLKMQLDPLEWSQIAMMSGRLPEPRTLELFRQLLEPGDVFIDIGAHVGLHTLVAARAIGPNGSALAVDPQPYNCDRLLTNAALNNLSNVTVVCAAAGARDDFVLLHNQKANDKARLSLAGQGPGDVANRFETPIVTIDSLAKRHGLTTVSLLKIDVEGYEREVLAGAVKTLAVTQNLVFEVLPETDPRLVQDVSGFLAGAGFTLRQIDGSPWAPGQVSIENNVWAARK